MALEVKILFNISVKKPFIFIGLASRMYINRFRIMRLQQEMKSKGVTGRGLPIFVFQITNSG